MTHVHADPTHFREQVLHGFAAAYGRYAQRVPGASGFVRQGGPRQGKVALVVGGGSGHYPSYSGTLGLGFADGAVLGDVFASPSAEQVYRVARAADGGAGVVLAFGNYAGDRLNFGAAQERLRAEGIDCRLVYVTDDIASAVQEERALRRGIAGTALVYKVGGAAAERGDDVAGVETALRAANAATFSYGVAFGGCTLPGAAEPLFTVERGTIEFGLGIHGEPGVRTGPWVPANELAKELVDTLLVERPTGADGRVAVAVNGLGATKYEELFVLYGFISDLLLKRGLTPVLPEVGELVTSLDMAGCSVSIMWLDDELEALWSAPADTAAFRRGQPTIPTAAPIPGPDGDTARPVTEPAATGSPVPVTSPSSVLAAGVARAVIASMAQTVWDHEQELGRLDAVAGDGDHGVGMARGMRAAVEACADPRFAAAGAGTMLRAAGESFADKAGGTSGMLWGLLLVTIGDAFGDQTPVTPAGLSEAVDGALAAVQRVGKAQRGDKTMLDALIPFADRFRDDVSAGCPLSAAWEAAAETASAEARLTAAIPARVGRARPLAERSIGTPDPGATSLALMVTAAVGALAATPCGRMP